MTLLQSITNRALVGNNYLPGVAAAASLPRRALRARHGARQSLACRFTTYRHRFARAAPAPRAKRNDALLRFKESWTCVARQKSGKQLRRKILFLLVLF